MINRGRLGGFWALLAGGAALVVLLVVLHPVLSATDCPNYGGNGNASAFPDPRWDLWFPALLFGWVTLVAIEQTLPTAWRDRSGAEAAGRALTAIMLALTASCCLYLPPATVCR